MITYREGNKDLQHYNLIRKDSLAEQIMHTWRMCAENTQYHNQQPMISAIDFLSCNVSLSSSLS
jgi:hypothetical protein